MPPYVTRNNLCQKTKEWMSNVKQFNRDLTVNPQKAALLVVDMQNYFLDEKSHAYMCGAYASIPNIKLLIEKFRELKRPVIYTRHMHKKDKSDAGIMQWFWSDLILEGTEESQIFHELKPKKAENVIVKHRYSAFFQTDLEKILKDLSVNEIVMTGTMTNLCCESTTRDAFYRDYKVFFMADATGTSCEEMHKATLLNMSYGFACVKETGQVLKELGV